ncbi:hypothetical protein MNBD_ALPHA08-275 [hydrothermal vent metagenome]|uniref:Uncharacterized protein n=1 Tax=hydrothermal vent metagenome TaxID=652676 RepID=A0A3B0S5R8_9ZZZZ
MARASLEKLKDSIGTVMVEHERDRESLVTLLSHANKMLNKYQSLLEQEEQLIDDFANERKIEVRKLFSQLRCTEDERIAHLERHITDMDGELEAEVTELATAKQTNDEVVERLDTAKQRPQKQVAH